MQKQRSAILSFACVAVLVLAFVLAYAKTSRRSLDFGVVVQLSSSAEADEESKDNFYVAEDINQERMSSLLVPTGQGIDERSVVWRTRLSPQLSGDYLFSFEGTDSFSVRLDGEKIIKSDGKKSDISAEKYVHLTQGNYYDLEIEWERVYGSLKCILYWQRAGTDERIEVPEECFFLPADMAVPQQEEVDLSQAQLNLKKGDTGGTIAISGSKLDAVTKVELGPATGESSLPVIEAPIVSASHSKLEFKLPAGLAAGKRRIWLLDAQERRWYGSAFFVLGAEQEPTRTETPHPHRARTEWQSLNGSWDFCFDPKEKGLDEQWYRAGASSKASVYPQESSIEGEAELMHPERTIERDPFVFTIQVPYSWTSAASGIGEELYTGTAWYRRSFELNSSWATDEGEVKLCFGAVDQKASVWLNGEWVGAHDGSYESFEVDITKQLRKGENLLVVRIDDQGVEGYWPVGRQGYESPKGHLETSGLWQPVWLERYAGATRISTCTAELSDDMSEAALSVSLAGQPGHFELDWKLESQRYDIQTGKDVKTGSMLTAHTEGIALPGSNALAAPVDAASVLKWSPDEPNLYVGTVTLRQDGKILDTVKATLGFRAISTKKISERDNATFIAINGQARFLLGVGVQGWWDEGGYTPQDADAFRADLVAAKELGFNALRMVQKVEDPIFYWWCDRLGLLVQQDLPRPMYVNAQETGGYTYGRHRYEKLLKHCLAQVCTHPSVMGISLFHEDWGILGKTKRNNDGKVSLLWKEELLERLQAENPSLLIDDNAGNTHLEQTDILSAALSIENADKALLDSKRREASIFEGSYFGFVEGHVNRGQVWMYSRIGPSVARLDGDQILLASNSLGALRMRHKLAGAFWVNLYNVGWEKNGLLDAKRKPKSASLASSMQQLATSQVVVGVSLNEGDLLPGGTLTGTVEALSWLEGSVEGSLHWELVDAAGTVQSSDSFALNLAPYGSAQNSLALKMPVDAGTYLLRVWIEDAAGTRLGASNTSIQLMWPNGLLERLMAE